MNEKMKINEIAKLSGVTVRTLHYYDEIGLLNPCCTSSSGYRFYDEKSMETLQQILFFRELDFSLGEIREIMQNPFFDRVEALSRHRDMLVKRRRRIEGLIALVDKNIRGEKNMSFREFSMTEIEKCRKEYANEARQRWGNSAAFAESESRTAGYGREEWQEIDSEARGILGAFAVNIDKEPGSSEIQDMVAKWQKHISERFYNCTREILSCLGQMYVNDERFKANIDRNGPGTADFIARAIEIYCRK